MQCLASEKGRYVPFKEGATEFAPARERVRYWESYTTSELIGLRCSTYAEEGLNARQRNFDLGALRIADIVGNEHVVERTMPIVRRHPKHSLFACLLLECSTASNPIRWFPKLNAAFAFCWRTRKSRWSDMPGT